MAEGCCAAKGSVMRAGIAAVCIVCLSALGSAHAATVVITGSDRGASSERGVRCRALTV